MGGLGNPKTGGRVKGTPNRRRRASLVLAEGLEAKAQTAIAIRHKSNAALLDLLTQEYALDQIQTLTIDELISLPVSPILKSQVLDIYSGMQLAMERLSSAQILQGYEYCAHCKNYTKKR